MSIVINCDMLYNKTIKRQEVTKMSVHELIMYLFNRALAEIATSKRMRAEGFDLDERFQQMELAESIIDAGNVLMSLRDNGYCR